MKSRFFLCFGLILFSFQVLAVDVSWEGYFRTRGNFQYNLDLNRDQKPNTRNYTDIRFRLNPTFYVTDKIRIKSSWNILNGYLGDNPLRTMPYNNPARAYDSQLDPTESNTSSGSMGRTSTDTTYKLEGGATAPDAAFSSQGYAPIYMRRAWAEIDVTFGTIKAGRMPNDFGLGIFANAGDGIDQDVGSSRDRVLFETAFGDYYAIPGAGWLYEGALDQAADDFYEYFLIFGRKAEDQHVAFYLSYNGQGSARDASNGSLINTETAYWAFDFFAQDRFSIAKLAAELALFSGKYAGKDLIAINAVARADWDLGKISVRTEAGYSSGTKDADSTANEIKTYAFSRDYDVAMLMFNEALPGGKNLKNSSGTYVASVTSPRSGAISNAIYARFNMDYQATTYFHPGVNVVSAMNAVKSQGAGGRWYGFEYDLVTYWPMNPHWTGELSFGHFVPGPVYDHVSKAQSALVFKGGITAHF